MSPRIDPGTIPSAMETLAASWAAKAADQQRLPEKQYTREAAA